MPDIYCYSYVEDQPSAEVLKKIIHYRNGSCKNSIIFRGGFPVVKNGNGAIKKMTSSFLNMAALGQYTLILTDLDQEPCAPEIIRQWFFPSKDMKILPTEVIFRIAIRAIESWVLADRKAFADFMGIPMANFTDSPDDLPRPKQYLLNTIRSKGKKKWHQEMLPKNNASIGSMYNEKICNFIKEKWSAQRAARVSPSLSRTINTLCNL